jgi:hypothetical protein
VKLFFILGRGILGGGLLKKDFNTSLYKMKAFVDSKGLSFVICRFKGKATPKIGKFLDFYFIFGFSGLN